MIFMYWRAYNCQCYSNVCHIIIYNDFFKKIWIVDQSECLDAATLTIFPDVIRTYMYEVGMRS